MQALQASVPAGVSASIRVTVRDQFDNPVSGVTPTLGSSGSNNTLQRARSDRRGRTSHRHAELHEGRSEDRQRLGRVA